MPDLGVSWQWIGAAVFGAACLYFLVRMVFGQRDPEYVKQVREYASQGVYDKAGMLQLKHGHFQEALNLFVRGEHWTQAATACERLNNFHDAGDYARQAGDWERAAKLFAKGNEPGEAAACYKELGMLVEAAKVLEGAGRPSEVAFAWEEAFNRRREQIEPTGDEDALPELAELAKRVSKAMHTVGDLVRARDFEKMTQIDVLRHRLGFDDLEVEVEMDTGGNFDAPTSYEGPTDAERRPPDPSKTEMLTNGPAVDADGRYKLVEKLGEGGMGEVYRGIDTRLDRNVALKFLPPWMTSNEMMKKMFKQEAKLAASLNHPNIITIHDFGVMDKRPFLCMELVEGHTLTDELKEHPKGLPLLTVVNIARGLFKALDFAHDRGVIHRDIKPANVMVTKQGRVKLADFGIARMGDSEKTTRIIGTPAYMAPEQFRGKGVDARTDIFAAGVTLYELLTGKQPFEGADRSTPAVSPKEIRSDIPMRLDTLVQRCIALDPVYRYASDQEVLDHLTAIRGHLEGQLRGLASGHVRSVPDTAAPAEKPTAWELMRRRSRKIDTVHINRRED